MKVSSKGRIAITSAVPSYIYKMADEGFPTFTRGLEVEELNKEVFLTESIYSGALVKKVKDIYNDDVEVMRKNIQDVLKDTLRSIFGDVQVGINYEDCDKVIYEFTSKIEFKVVKSSTGSVIHPIIKDDDLPEPYGYLGYTSDKTPINRNETLLKAIEMNMLPSKPVLDTHVPGLYGRSRFGISVLDSSIGEEFILFYVGANFINRHPVLTLGVTPIIHSYYDIMVYDDDDGVPTGMLMTDYIIESKADLMKYIYNIKDDYKVEGYIRKHILDYGGQFDLSSLSEDDFSELWDFVEEERLVFRIAIMNKTASDKNIIEKLMNVQKNEIMTVEFITEFFKDKFSTDKILEFDPKIQNNKPKDRTVYISNFYDMKSLFKGDEVKVNGEINVGVLINSDVPGLYNNDSCDMTYTGTIPLTQTGIGMLTSERFGYFPGFNYGLDSLNMLMDESLNMDARVVTAKNILQNIPYILSRGKFHYRMFFDHNFETEIFPTIKDVFMLCIVPVEKENVEKNPILSEYNSDTVRTLSMLDFNDEDVKNVPYVVLEEDIKHLIKVSGTDKHKPQFVFEDKNATDTKSFIIEGELDLNDLEVSARTYNKFISAVFPGTSLRFELAPYAATAFGYPPYDDEELLDIQISMDMDSTYKDVSGKSVIHVSRPLGSEYSKLRINISINSSMVDGYQTMRYSMYISNTGRIIYNNPKMSSILLDTRSMKPYVVANNDVRDRLVLIPVDNVSARATKYFGLDSEMHAHILSFNKYAEWKDHIVNKGNESSPILFEENALERVMNEYNVDKHVTYSKELFDDFISSGRRDISELNEDLNVCVVTDEFGKVVNVFMKNEFMKNVVDGSWLVSSDKTMKAYITIEDGIVYHEYKITIDDNVHEFKRTLIPSLSLIPETLDDAPVWTSFRMNRYSTELEDPSYMMSPRRSNIQVSFISDKHLYQSAGSNKPQIERGMDTFKKTGDDISYEFFRHAIHAYQTGHQCVQFFRK